MPEEMETRPHVRIHIDQKPYKSPNPTTGEALYVLGQVEAVLELYREVKGERQEPPLEDSAESVRLNDDEHFHSRPHRGFTIIVNGRKKNVTSRVLSFDEIVRLAFDPVPTGENILFTITYRNGPRSNPEGTLQVGVRIRIRDGMVFNVTATDKS